MQKLVETGATMPGSGGRKITKFGNFAFDGGRLVFQATNICSAGSVCWTGIYEWTSSGLKRVADRSTLVPGSSTRRFRSFGSPSVSASRVLWYGEYHSSPRFVGIVEGVAGGLSSIVNQSDTVPGGTGTFGLLGFGHSLLGNRVVISNPVHGVHQHVSGSLTALVPAGATVGGTTQRLSRFFKAVATSTGAVLRAENTSYQGVFRANTLGLRAVADTTVPIPGAPPGVLFKKFLLGDADADRVVFLAGDRLAQHGLYLHDQTGLHTIAQRGQSMPHTTDRYSYLVAPSIHGDAIAYVASFAWPVGWSTLRGYSGLMIRRGGSTDVVLDSSMTLDNRQIQVVGLLPDAFRGDDMVVRVRFSDGHLALYRITRCGPLAYGGRAPGSTLDIAWKPVSGSTGKGAVKISGARPGSTGWLGIGIGRSRTRYLGIDLLLDLSNPTVFLPIVYDVNGGLALPFDLATVPQGWRSNAQAFELSTAGTPSLIASNGLEFVICR